MRGGWQLESAVIRAGTGATLDVTLRGRTGDVLVGRDLRARLERPTDARADRLLALTETAPGRYAGGRGAAGRPVAPRRRGSGPDGVELRRERRLTLD